MAERPTIALRVDEGQKQKWAEYVEEEDEYDSLSHLIRTAVAHEMSEEYGRLDRVQGGGSDERIGDVLTKVNQIQGRLDDIEDEISATREEAGSLSLTSGEAKATVFDALPKGPEDAVTVDDLKSEILEETGDVWDDLEILFTIGDLTGSGVVETTEDGSKYYKKP